MPNNSIIAKLLKTAPYDLQFNLIKYYINTLNDRVPRLALISFKAIIRLGRGLSRAKRSCIFLVHCLLSYLFFFVSSFSLPFRHTSQSLCKFQLPSSELIVRLVYTPSFGLYQFHFWFSLFVFFLGFSFIEVIF